MNLLSQNFKWVRDHQTDKDFNCFQLVQKRLKSWAQSRNYPVTFHALNFCVLDLQHLFSLKCTYLREKLTYASVTYRLKQRIWEHFVFSDLIRDAQRVKSLQMFPN